MYIKNCVIFLYMKIASKYYSHCANIRRY